MTTTQIYYETDYYVTGTMLIQSKMANISLTADWDDTTSSTPYLCFKSTPNKKYDDHELARFRFLTPSPAHPMKNTTPVSEKTSVVIRVQRVHGSKVETSYLKSSPDLKGLQVVPTIQQASHFLIQHKNPDHHFFTISDVKHPNSFIWFLGQTGTDHFCLYQTKAPFNVLVAFTPVPGDRIPLDPSALTQQEKTILMIAGISFGIILILTLVLKAVGK